MRFLPLLALLLVTMATARAQYRHPPAGACPDRPRYDHPHPHRPILGRVIDELRLIRREVSDLFYWDGGYYHPYPPHEYPAPPPRMYRDERPDSYGYRRGANEQTREVEPAPARPRYGERGRIAEQLPQTRPEDDFIQPGTRWEPIEPETQASATPAGPSPEPRPEDTKRESEGERSGGQDQSDDRQAAGDNESKGSTFTEAEKRNFPWATRTDKPGFVRSPYPPHELMDVTAFEYGDLAREPEGGRIFRVPR